MPDYKIYPIQLGRTVRPGPGETPILAFYVTDGEHKIVVDTGGTPADGKSHMPYYQEADETLDQKLQALGVDPADVDMVILTHLHWDHVSNNHLFPNAKFYAQRRELHYAAAPIPLHAPGYNQALIFQTKYEVLDGDEEILPGLSVLLVPSHSDGSQCVIVETTAGRYAITGDFITQYSQWESNPRVCGGIHTSLIDYFASFKKLEKACDYILPGHDYKVLDQKVYPE